MPAFCFRREERARRSPSSAVVVVCYKTISGEAVGGRKAVRKNGSGSYDEFGGSFYKSNTAKTVPAVLHGFVVKEGMASVNRIVVLTS
jgi:hypothetical protein